MPITELWREMQKRESEKEAYGAAAAGLVADLEAAGIRIDRLRDLRRPGVGDRRAVPILVKWLGSVEVEPLKCDIAWVLGSHWAQPEGTRALIAEYRQIDHEVSRSTGRVRAAICTSLERVADEATLDELCDIALDPRHGAQRGMAVVALGNMRHERERALEVLLSLLEDDNVVLFALLGLVKLNAREEALRPVAILTGHHNPVVRKVARRTIQRWTASR